MLFIFKDCMTDLPKPKPFNRGGYQWSHKKKSMAQSALIYSARWTLTLSLFQKVKTCVMCAWIVWIWFLSPSNHPCPDHLPIVIVIQLEHWNIQHLQGTNQQNIQILGCNWLSAIKGMALWSRGFSRGSLFKTWPKPKTAHENPLAPSRLPFN